jgi:hypothetical protein
MHFQVHTVDGVATSNSNSDFIAIISIILPVIKAHSLMDLLYPLSDLQCCSHNILVHDHP